MGRRLDGLRALSRQDRRRLIACAALLPIVHVLLACCGYKRTRRLVDRLTRRASARAASALELEDAKALARLASIAGRHGAVEATCLRQALLVYGWLRARGLEPRLDLGVAEAPQRFHAWVELGGVRLLAGDEGFRPFGNASPRGMP